MSTVRSMITCLVAALVASAAAAQTPKVLAEYPSGNFLENLVVQADGTVLATSYFASTIERVGPDDAVSTFAALPDHPVSLIAFGDGWLVAVHGAPFTSGPEFTQTQAFLRLDASGAVVGTFAAPSALFLNGMARLDDATVVVADSIAGTLWQVRPGDETVVPWLQDAALAQPADMTVFKPGANGLKRVGDTLYVSNSARGTISTIGIGPDGAAQGGLTEIAKVDGIDDFWVNADGSIVIATHAAKLIERAADGTIRDLLPAGCDACTAVAPRGDDLVVLTTGGLLEGLGQPARILAVAAAD